MKTIMRKAMLRKGMLWKGMLRKGMLRKGMIQISNISAITGLSILSEYAVTGEFNYLQYIW